MANVLIADDEQNLRKVLSALLRHDGHKTIAVPNGESALHAVSHEYIDMLITDLRMPGMGGLELLDAVHQSHPTLPVIVITAHGSIDTAMSALRKGAVDYITKPFDKEELKLAVRKALAAKAKDDAEPSLLGSKRFIGDSESMRQVFRIIEKVAATPSSVLITGDSGTGKEMVAASLHAQSDRAEQALVKVNCAAIPKDLMESEFFGHEKGAFTGAVATKPGRFELADQGTLFLDEIAEIPIDMQVKLLRALQEGEFERVGGVETIAVDVRVIAATNRDLQLQIENGEFREDLFYRLNVVPIVLPALRNRQDDILPLAQNFIEKYSARLGRPVKELSSAAIAALQAYGWPGNVRELENVIERILVFAEGEGIEVEDLPNEIRGRPRDEGPRLQVRAESLNVAAEIADIGVSGDSMKEIVRRATAGLERDLIVRALEYTNGNITRAARLLRISRKGLQNKMKELGLRET